MASIQTGWLLLLCLGHISAIQLDHEQLLNRVHIHHSRELTDSAAMTGSAAVESPQIQWGTNESHIEVQLIYPTTGWMALGLTPNGGMDQSDVLFGYVGDKTGKLVVQDRFNNYKPGSPVDLTLDEQQDWTAVSGSQNATHTTIRAVRALRTCDFVDRPFVHGFMKVIFSYHSSDPASETGPILKHTQRGSGLINFLERGASLVPKEPIVAHLNFTMDDFRVPGQKTSEFHCRLLRVPKYDRKMHAVLQTPVVDPRAIDLLHHIVIMGCKSGIQIANASVANGDPFACGPEDYTNVMAECYEVAAIWAVGGKDTNYPANAGFPVTPEMEGRYYMLQVHYNNPQRKRPLDSSGISFSLTDQLRDQDVGTMMMGSTNLNELFLIPPGVDQFTMRAQCSDLCTDTIPVEGVYIFSGLSHMHTRGRIGVARHFRGDEEAPSADEQPKISISITRPRPTLPAPKFLPGNHERNVPGLFDYYPKPIYRAACPYYMPSGLINAVRYPPAKLIEAGVVAQPGETLLEAVDNRGMSLPLYYDIIAHAKRTSWTSSAVRRLEDYYSSKSYVAFCDMSGGTPLFTLQDKPRFVEPFQDTSDYQCVHVWNNASTATEPTVTAAASTSSPDIIATTFQATLATVATTFQATLATVASAATESATIGVDPLLTTTTAQKNVTTGSEATTAGVNATAGGSTDPTVSVQTTPVVIGQSSTTAVAVNATETGAAVAVGLSVFVAVVSALVLASY
ncbi:putative DBH-like monooxygenase protein 1 [Hypsibius exemplaris]|uniref:DBH-like monooxygenase protein 1 n=1 Tax=Hypsibius exemplaris TaxID=2072580 RepID=A0A1W0W953_HYPEX|nr:putative DBH-like monooxygenase protein 1 [Hypsibius exemplaris]